MNALLTARQLSILEVEKAALNASVYYVEKARMEEANKAIADFLTQTTIEEVGVLKLEYTLNLLYQLEAVQRAHEAMRRYGLNEDKAFQFGKAKEDFDAQLTELVELTK